MDAASASRRPPRPRRRRIASRVLVIGLLAGAVPARAVECAFVAAAGLDAITVVDVRADRVTGLLPVGQRPAAVAVSADGRRIWATNHEAHTVSVLDLDSRRAVAVVPVGLFPTGVALHPDGTRVYVSDRRSAQLSVLDAVEPRVIGTIPTQGDGPAGIAISRDGRRAWVANSFADRVAEIDLETARPLGSAPVGSLPFALALTPDGAHLYVGNLEAGTVSVVRTADRAVVATIPVGGNPTGVGVHPDGHTAYVANAPIGAVAVIDTATQAVTTAITLGPPQSTELTGMALSADGARGYVAEFIFANLFAFDAARHAPLGFAPLGGITANPESVTLARLAGPCPASPAPLLTAAAGAADDLLFLERADLLPASGTLRVEDELVTYDGRQLREAVQNVTRGLRGTSAAAHAAGTPAVLVGEHGDANCDGRLSAADLAALPAQIPRAFHPCGGDLDRDQTITPADRALLVAELYVNAF